MCRVTALEKYGLIITVLLLCVLAQPLLAQTGTEADTNKTPEKGISITLSVYSGRMNPQWWLTSDSALRRITTLIDSLKVTSDSLFDYNEWNRLGYASFWIEPKGLDGLPVAIHIWRNNAFVILDEKGKFGHAINGAELYDLLAGQAERRDQGYFFENYRKLE